MKKCIFLLFVCFLFFAVNIHIFSQELENSQNNDNELELAPETDDRVFVINSFNFNVTGITRPFAMINKADLIVGEKITGQANLEAYIEKKQQLLFNERVLETVSIEHTVGEINEDGKYPVDLVINVKDTWNIIAIPRPQYSSNSGFDITIKARDYNFLGTMSPLRLDLGYSYDELGRHFFNVMLDSDIPFRALGLNWEINFDHDFSYRRNMEKTVYYKNTTGFSVDFSVGRTTPSVGANISFIVNEENSDSDKPKYGDFQEGLYISTNPFFSWSIPTGLEVGEYGELTYSPYLSATFNHELPSWPLDDNRKGPFMSFSHSLGFGRIDWKENNLQKGLSFSVSNSFSYDFFKLKNDNEPLSYYIGSTGKGYFIFTDFLGLSTRLMYRHWFNTHTDTAGDVMRGILDKDVSAEYMISLNLDIPLRALKFRPSEWFNKKKLRILDFDLFFSPIFDIAFYRYPDMESYSPENLLMTGGLEIIVFPKFFRSLFLRASLGFDFSKKSLSTGRELFIGTELHY